MRDLVIREQFLSSFGKERSLFLKERKLVDMKEVIIHSEHYLEAHRYSEFAERKSKTGVPVGIQTQNQIGCL